MLVGREFRLLIGVAWLGLLVFGCSARSRGPMDADKSAVIDCKNGTFTSVGESDPKRNVVYEGRSLTWYLVGDSDMKVKIEFVDQDYAEKSSSSCIKSKGSPFLKDPSSPGEETRAIRNAGFKLDQWKTGPILRGKGSNSDTQPNCYTYKVTCIFKDGQSKEIDPMIDVPKP